MCKALTLHIRRCRHVARVGEYCGTHNMNLDPNGLDLNGANLSEICSRIRNRYFNREQNLLPEFSSELPNEEIRQFVFDNIMPFLRDCWKMGIAHADFPEETLRIHYERVGNPGVVQLPQRQWTPLQRQEESTRIRMEGQRQHMERLYQNRIENIPHDPILGIPVFPPFRGILYRQNAGGIPDNALPVVQQPLHHAGQLPSIANDPQSVHRSSVNKSVIESAKLLKSMPWDISVWPEKTIQENTKFIGGKKLFEYIYLWSDIYTRAESKELFPKLLAIIEKNYISRIVNIEEEVFEIKPWVAIYKVCQWTWTRPEEEQKEIFKRLLDEVYEGREMCTQGKVSRIINVLCGFHPKIHVGLSGKELLQDRMARLANQSGLDPEVRIEEGREILRDAEVPEEEWDAWLEPLLLF